MKIHFVVVGGSLTGYASALTLCKVGHRVTVLDIEDEVESVSAFDAHNWVRT